MSNGASIFAHRGFSGHYPENTLPAFQAALDAGSEGIEFDVQMTKDGTLAVIHDERVERTTDGIGYVKDFHFNQLCLLDAGSWFATSFAGVSIPSLEMVFAWANSKENNFFLNVELKNDLISYIGMEEKVIDLIRRFKLENRVILSSFNPESLKRIRALHPTLPTGYLISGIPHNAVKIARNIGANAIHCQAAYALSECGRAAIAAGVPLRIYTVNDTSMGKALDEAGVEVIMTDFPDLFLNKEMKSD